LRRKKKDKWKVDKPVERGWTDKNITGFGDECDDTTTFYKGDTRISK